MTPSIRVRGARQHNLKGVDVDIPRGALTVITGPSGSGKSSLAFDTVYAEGQRRYIESLSTYAKQFLERMPKPAVDLVEGVAPAVAIDQRNQVLSSRSTVGTVTEVYDYLRLLWARVGIPHCPRCNTPVVPDTVASAVNSLLDLKAGTRLVIAFAPEAALSTGHLISGTLVANLLARGYVRVLVDGETLYLPDLDLPEDWHSGDHREEEVLVVVDRAVVRTEERERLSDSLLRAFTEGGGRAVALAYEQEGSEPRRFFFDQVHRCRGCGVEMSAPEPVLFSFNSPAGACDTCSGFGAVLEYAPELIVPDQGKSLAEGALDPWTKPRYGLERYRLSQWVERVELDEHESWEALPSEAREALVHGGTFRGRKFRGVIPFLRSKERKRYKPYIRMFLRSYQIPVRCESCDGARLKPEALWVKVDDRSIADVAALSVRDVACWVRGDLNLGPFARGVARTVRRELMDRLSFLEDVGLGYLTLDRQARSLSGGEMQRIRVAGCLGSRLVDTLYVLDEPSIGLHPHDMEAFTTVLSRLARRGNTVLVVEHEPSILAVADHVVELGPRGGQAGGEVVFEGTWTGLTAAETGTGSALRRRRRWKGSRPDGDRQGIGGSGRPPAPTLRLRGATLHNVKGVDVEVPHRALTAVTGVSGSGKSTLVRGVLLHALEHTLRGGSSARPHLGDAEGHYDSLVGYEGLSDVVFVDQSPIGRSPRSNPATYVGAFGALRDIFASTPAARTAGYTAGWFSFNRQGGRCERCKGVGFEVVEMVFLSDVTVVCESCGGSRYRPEVLEVTVRGISIRDALEMTVDEAIRFFVRADRLGARLWQLQRVGLGYLRLGQPTNTLSGGEAQRLKIARDLARGRREGACLYMFDEPTVGLGLAEVETLLTVLRALVRDGHTVVVIEHNLDLVSAADHVIDIGPGPAAEGGRVVASGRPSEIARVAESRTGAFLRNSTRLGL